MYLNYYATDVDSCASKLRFYSLVVGVVVVASRHSDANMQTGIIVDVRLTVPTPTFLSQRNKKNLVAHFVAVIPVLQDQMNNSPQGQT